MRRASTPSSGSGKNYVRFAGITLIAALVVAMLVDSRPKAGSASDKAQGQLASAPARPPVKASTNPFAADGMAVPSGVPSQQSSQEADRLAARADPTKPPPGDPAEQIGKQHIQAPGTGPFIPSQQQAGNLIAESRARSGGVDQGDEARAPS